MRVMVLVKASKNSEAGVLPDEKLLDEMGKYNEALVKAGIMKDGDGLKPTSAAKRIHFNKGQKTVINGPFAHVSELVAGYWIWEVKDMNEALEWAKKCPDPMPGEESDLEIRPVYELADFGDAATPERLAQEDKMREEIAKQK